MKPHFEKLAIVGTGLIGGSLGLAVRRRRLAREVVGVARTTATVREAVRRGAVDRGSTDIAMVAGADCVVLCASVNTIRMLAPQISRLVSPECIVTDAGSTKRLIVRDCGKVFPRFVGAHPFAGSERRGVAFAREDLFADALCVLTPVRGTDRDAQTQVVRLWQAVGCRTMTMDPVRHDALAGFVSHLPHAAAFALMNTMPSAYRQFAAGGLKDTTRIAASDEGLWADIFVSNKDIVARALTAYEHHLRALRKAIASGNIAQLRRLLGKARRLREGLR